MNYRNADFEINIISMEKSLVRLIKRRRLKRNRTVPEGWSQTLRNITHEAQLEIAVVD